MILPHVADKNARDAAFEHGVAVDLDVRLRPAAAQAPGSGVHVRGLSDAVLEAAVGLLDHAGVEASTRHHSEALAIHRSRVDRSALAVQADSHRRAYVVWDAQVFRQQVRRARGNDRQGGARAGDGVDASLNGSVAAPDKDQLSAVG